MVKGLLSSALLVGVFAATCSGSAVAAFIDARGAVAESSIAYKGAALEDVLSGVVPTSIILTYENDGIGKTPVTIKSTGTWDKLVREAATQAGAVAKFDPDGKAVRIESSKPAAVPVTSTTAVAQAGAPTVTSAPLVAVATIPAVAPTPAQPTVVYNVEVADGRISKTVDRWAKLSGKQMVWDAGDVDYPIEAAAAFGPELRGALGGLFGALQGAETPLRACIYDNQPNSVIRVIRSTAKCKED